MPTMYATVASDADRNQIMPEPTIISMGINLAVRMISALLRKTMTRFSRGQPDSNETFSAFLSYLDSEANGARGTPSPIFKSSAVASSLHMDSKGGICTAYSPNAS